MRITVYETENPPLRFILTPECMQPSSDCVRQVGAVRMRGDLRMTEDLLLAISHNVPGFAGEFEFVVDGELAIRYVEALLQGAQHTDHPHGLTIAGDNDRTENA